MADKFTKLSKTQKMRKPMDAALRVMRSYGAPTPPCDFPIAKVGDGRAGESWMPWFTGWKLDDSDNNGFVAQWIASVDDANHIVVNLPGMEYGVFRKDTDFDIGTQRVSAEATREEVGLLISAGHGLLMALIDQERAKVTHG